MVRRKNLYNNEIFLGTKIGKFYFFVKGLLKDMEIYNEFILE